MHDLLLPSLESTYQKAEMPGHNMTDMTPHPNPLMPENLLRPQRPSVPQMPATAPQMPATAPKTPATAPQAPATAPQTPVTAPTLPPTPPESDQGFLVSPLLPRLLPNSPNITVPINPLLPPNISTIMNYEGLQYMNGYLRTQINKNVHVEFLVGSSNILSRKGKLVGVGLNYILLEDPVTGDVCACDFYNIKFCMSLTGHQTAPAE